MSVNDVKKVSVKPSPHSIHAAKIQKKSQICKNKVQIYARMMRKSENFNRKGN